MATTIGQDSFTGTDGTLLQAHTPNIGGTWTKHATWGGTNFEIKTNAIRQVAPDGVSDVVYHIDNPPNSADYYAQILIAAQSLPDNFSYFGVAARIDPAAKTCYFLCWRQGGGFGWQCFKVVAGTYTLLGTSAGSPLVFGAPRTLRLDVTGTTLTCTVDGAGVAGSPITDAAISAKGLAGFICNSPTNTAATAIWADDFIAVGSDPTGGGGGGGPLIAGGPLLHGALLRGGRMAG